MTVHGSLLHMLCDVHTDAECTLIEEVLLACTVDSLAMLAAASSWLHRRCQPRLAELHEQHELMGQDLATRLGFFYHPHPEPWQLLANVRSLTIPDTLPVTLWPLLGKWLRADGRLAQVNCVRCRSWIQSGQVVGWIELDPVRAGGIGCIPEERITLDKLDTPDGLLKTVLDHAHRKAGHPWMFMSNLP